MPIIASPIPSATPTPGALVGPTDAPPTDTPPTGVPPTDTPQPTDAPTDTPIPPTFTPVPPTDTPMPPTDMPTVTPIPPTDTAVPPTDTPTDTATPTRPPTDTPTPTRPPTPTPVRNSSILVLVYWDRDKDGQHDSSDTVLSAALELYAGPSCSGTAIATPIEFFGYKFVDLSAGTYCVKVIDNSVEDVGACALIPRNNHNWKRYTLGANDQKEDLDLGFPYVCQ
jgi:hypothetical protein